jgi:leucyl-tRNA synthetase
MFEEKYEPHEIEARWQKYWADHKTYKVENDDPRPKSYVLECSPIRPATCTWGMCGTTPSGT